MSNEATTSTLQCSAAVDARQQRRATPMKPKSRGGVAGIMRRSLWVVPALVGTTRCGNPLVPRVGMADPHAHVFPSDPDTLYVYATHDLNANNTFFRMDDWWVWRTKDLVHYQKVACLAPLGWEIERQRRECWATDAAETSINGTNTLFWYLSTGPKSVAVVRSRQGASGPWEDVLGKPLLPESLGKSLRPHPTEIRDPSVFFDPVSGHYYLYFGTFHYYVARLNPDMVSLAEKPRYVTVANAIGSAGPGHTDDKPFVHYLKGSNSYYLSWGCFYAIAKNPYGPFTYDGSVIDTSVMAPSFRLPHNTSQAWWADPNLQDRHGSFLEWHGQTYFFTNDQSHSRNVAVNPKFYRDVVAGYVHYYRNGSIAPVVINSTGVGQYDLRASSHRIEAENYFQMDCNHTGTRTGDHEQAQKLELEGASGGFVVGMAGGCSLDFPNILGLLDNDYSDVILVGQMQLSNKEEEIFDIEGLSLVHIRINHEQATSCSFRQDPTRIHEASPWSFFKFICDLPRRITAAQRRRYLQGGSSIPENISSHLRLELTNSDALLDYVYFQ